MEDPRARRIRAAIERVGETRDLDLGPVTEDFVWDMSHFEGWPDSQQYEGTAGAQRFLDEWLAAYDDWRLEVESELRGADAVGFVMRQSGRMRGMTAPVEMRFGQVWHFRGELLRRVELYSDPEEGLASVSGSEV